MSRKLCAAAGAVLIIAPLAAHAQSVDATGQRQARRIEQGAQSGALTGREYRRLERRRQRLQREERRMRARNHGRLTPRERRWLRAQQADLSRRIWRLKHNEPRR